jgi:hypothetical protein
MNKLIFLFFLNASLVPLSAFPQQEQSGNPSQQASEMNFSGKVSQDGMGIISDADRRAWRVTNPDTLEPYAGQKVTVRAQTVSGCSTSLHIVTVKPVKNLHTQSKGDNAFRR